jgi:hypothetical protein
MNHWKDWEKGTEEEMNEGRGIWEVKEEKEYRRV